MVLLKMVPVSNNKPLFESTGHDKFVLSNAFSDIFWELVIICISCCCDRK